MGWRDEIDAYITDIGEMSVECWQEKKLDELEAENARLRNTIGEIYWQTTCSMTQEFIKTKGLYIPIKKMVKEGD